MKTLLDKWEPKRWFGKAIKVILNIIRAITTLMLLVIPFLKLEDGWLEVFKWIWIVCVMLNLDDFADYKKARAEKLISPTFSVYTLFTFLYLCNYWNLIPLSVAIVVPLVIGTLEVAISISVHKAFRFTTKQELKLLPKKVTDGILLGSVYISALGLFILGHFLDEKMIFIYGIICIVMLFSSVISVISKGFNANKSLVSTIGIIVDILSVLALIGYLIYLIPGGEENNNLQEIVLALASAVIGGALTLAGVAWTIKHQSDSDKEEEKKKYKPFIVARETKIERNEKYVHKVETNLMFSNPEFENSDTIVMFTLKNPTEHLICITSIIYGDKPYQLHQNAHYYIDSKSEIQINIFTSNEEANKIESETFVILELLDALGNKYHNKLLIKDSLIVSTLLEEVAI